MTKLNFANDKDWWNSKTVWVNIIQVILGLSLLFLQQYEAGAVFTASGVINTILRFLTKEGILNPLPGK